MLASVLLDVTQKESISDSVEAADSVLTALRGVGDVHRPRVQHAGFVVLKSPDIPSMLVETAFISNATDERRLRDIVRASAGTDSGATATRCSPGVISFSTPTVTVGADEGSLIAIASLRGPRTGPGP